MSEGQQPDGYYPRLNSDMLNSGRFHGMIVAVVGSFKPNSAPDHHNVMLLNCSDGGMAKLIVEPDFGSSNNYDAIVEAIGLVLEDNTIQLFVVRGFGSDFDLGVYNEMIQLQMHNNLKSELFAHVV